MFCLLMSKSCLRSLGQVSIYWIIKKRFSRDCIFILWVYLAKSVNALELKRI